MQAFLFQPSLVVLHQEAVDVLKTAVLASQKHPQTVAGAFVSFCGAYLSAGVKTCNHCFHEMEKGGPLVFRILRLRLMAYGLYSDDDLLIACGKQFRWDFYSDDGHV